MEEKKMSFFQWFISVLRWERENYRVLEEETERVFKNITNEDN